MINEQELAEAVDRLREGDDDGLLVSYYDVIGSMAANREQMEVIVEMLLDDSLTIAVDANNDLFTSTATDLLIQAKESELTHQAELNEIEAFAERNNVTHKRACVMLGKPVNRYNELKVE